jgi:hypothetical protein
VLGLNRVPRFDATTSRHPARAVGRQVVWLYGWPAAVADWTSWCASAVGARSTGNAVCGAVGVVWTSQPGDPPDGSNLRLVGQGSLW